jgi:2-polyprenyl-6-methoxyphenol hydroxylase-like FAD-dependent oxidoreductase
VLKRPYPARSLLLPHVKPKVLKYIAFNGQRRTPIEAYQAENSDFNYQDTVGKKMDKTGKHVSYGLNDVKGGKAYHFWTYSRAAKGSDDALFKPDRSTQEASKIPEEFYDEVENSIFSDEINREITNDDKILSWLLRTVELSEKDLQSLPERVTLFGDAAHATPPVVSTSFYLKKKVNNLTLIKSQGGEGGEQAITDAIVLSNLLEKNGTGIQDNVCGNFHRESLPRWHKSIDDSVKRLEDMHRFPSAAL